MQCPKCKESELEIFKADVNLNRNGLRVWVSCMGNICTFSKVLELSLDDIIGIGRDPETEAESREAVRKAMNKVMKKDSDKNGNV